VLRFKSGSDAVHSQVQGLKGMWQREIKHEGLHKHRVVKGQTQEIVNLRVRMQIASWNDQWARVQAIQKKHQSQQQRANNKEAKRKVAEERTREAQRALDALGHLLADVLENDHAIDLSSLIDSSEYPIAQPAKPTAEPPLAEEPVPREPDINDTEFKPMLSLIARIIPSQRRKEIQKAADRFSEAKRRWAETMTARWERLVKAEAERRLRSEKASDRFKKLSTEWESDRNGWLAERERRNAAIEVWTQAYLAGSPEVIPDYCKLVLSASTYPDSFPSDAAVEYVAESRMVVVDYWLPDISVLPTLKEVKFIASRDTLQDVYVSDTWLNRTYDVVLYQIALRSLYELFQSDSAKAIDWIVFNGWVNSIDKATGKEANGCVLSIQVSNAEFIDINLANVDPKACFKKLKGVSAAKLTALQPIRPILQLNRDDKRFVPSHDVADGLDGTSNLAAMDWEDFEHLIRELFEKEFSADGGEVKITQASRDGGVDAIVFDPDPIRGGKIVIQAKRYTNTVSVSAVRDLFGTVHNEGANKGILVTTADYGPDAYEFAKGKPLTLISGSELLYLLAKHGHKARIDLREARMLAVEGEKSSRHGNS
jgi:restriction system protein